MAKGARSSIRKSNNKKLKARVFGPVETARTERLSAKLLELASQPKPPQAAMDVEQPAEVETKKAEPKAKDADAAMEVDSANQPRTSWIKAEKRAKAEKVARIVNKQRRKTVNSIGFGKNRVNKKRN